jgi:hypothetical protein
MRTGRGAQTSPPKFLALGKGACVSRNSREVLALSRCTALAGCIKKIVLREYCIRAEIRTTLPKTGRYLLLAAKYRSGAKQVGPAAVLGAGNDPVRAASRGA